MSELTKENSYRNLLKRASESLKNKRDYFQNLCQKTEDPLLLVNYEEERLQIQKDYDELKAKHSKLSEEMNDSEKNFAEKVSSSKKLQAIKEDELEHRLELLYKNHSNEISKTKLSFQRQFDEFNKKIKQLMVANAQLKCENAGLQMDGINVNIPSKDRTKEVEYYKNLMLQREAEVDKINEELIQVKSKMAALQPEHPDQLPTVAEGAPNVVSNEPDEIFEANLPSTESTSNNFQYIPNALSEAAPREKRFDEEWTADDYAKYEGMYYFKINSHPSKQHRQNAGDDKARKNYQETSTYATSLASTSATTTTASTSAITTSFSSKTKSEKQKGKKSTKQVKLLNESMQNAFFPENSLVRPNAGDDMPRKSYQETSSYATSLASTSATTSTASTFATAASLSSKTKNEKQKGKKSAKRRKLLDESMQNAYFPDNSQFK